MIILMRQRIVELTRKGAVLSILEDPQMLRMKTLGVTIVMFCILAVPGVVLAQTIQAPEVEPLNSLNFLVGDWVSESKLPGGKMMVRTITYKWVGKRRYLRAASERIEGGVTTKMDIIYFWDPKAERIRVWVLGSD